MDQDWQLVTFFTRLTQRQQQTIYLVSQGLSNRAVADRMVITPGSVAEHLTTVYEELSNLLALPPEQRANRYTLIRCFAGFFERHPDLAQAASPHASDHESRAGW